MPHPLDDLLDRAHRALLTGDLASLAALGPQVEALAGSPGRLDRAQAEVIRHKALRNAQLLQAAMRGLRAAQTRFADITAGPSLSIYDARGQRAALPAHPPTLGRRF